MGRGELFYKSKMKTGRWAGKGDDMKFHLCWNITFFRCLISLIHITHFHHWVKKTKANIWKFMSAARYMTNIRNCSHSTRLTYIIFKNLTAFFNKTHLNLFWWIMWLTQSPKLWLAMNYVKVIKIITKIHLILILNNTQQFESENWRLS
jgi:hypothetical protein